jgi:hypothetical protein
MAIHRYSSSKNVSTGLHGTPIHRGRLTGVTSKVGAMGMILSTNATKTCSSRLQSRSNGKSAGQNGMDADGVDQRSRKKTTFLSYNIVFETHE